MSLVRSSLASRSAFLCVIAVFDFVASLNRKNEKEKGLTSETGPYFSVCSFCICVLCRLHFGRFFLFPKDDFHVHAVTSRDRNDFSSCLDNSILISTYFFLSSKQRPSAQHHRTDFFAFQCYCSLEDSCDRSKRWLDSVSQ